jgi:hypothetical protein
MNQALTNLYLDLLMERDLQIKGKDFIQIVFSFYFILFFTFTLFSNRKVVTGPISTSSVVITSSELARIKVFLSLSILVLSLQV